MSLKARKRKRYLESQDDFDQHVLEVLSEFSTTMAVVLMRIILGYSIATTISLANVPTWYQSVWREWDLVLFRGNYVYFPMRFVRPHPRSIQLPLEAQLVALDAKNGEIQIRCPRVNWKYIVEHLHVEDDVSPTETWDFISSLVNDLKRCDGLYHVVHEQDGWVFLRGDIEHGEFSIEIEMAVDYDDDNQFKIYDAPLILYPKYLEPTEPELGTKAAIVYDQLWENYHAVSFESLIPLTQLMWRFQDYKLLHSPSCPDPDIEYFRHRTRYKHCHEEIEYYLGAALGNKFIQCFRDLLCSPYLKKKS